MSDPASLLVLGSTLTVGVGVIAAATLSGWQQWLELRRADIEREGARRSPRGTELAELRERVKRLEAIANG